MRFVRLLSRWLALSVLALPLMSAVPLNPAQGQWTGDFSIPAFDGRTNTCAIFRGQYVVAGDFGWAGDTRASNVAIWTGANWSELGGGLLSRVNHLAVWDTTLLAATSGYGPEAPVMRFDGTAWRPLGANIYGNADAVLVAGGSVYAAGTLLLSGSSNDDRVVKWNGSTWDPVGGAFDARVLALALWNGDLYAAGEFLNSDSGYVSHIARWNGAHWVAVGSRPGLGSTGTSQVSTLAVWQDRLYAGGDFTDAGNVAVNGVAAWDGSTWSALPGTPTVSQVSDLEPDGNRLGLGGVFETPNEWASGLMTFDGQSWFLGSTYPDWGIADIATGDGALIAVGSHSLLQHGAPAVTWAPTRNVLVRDPEWRGLEAWQPTMRGLLGPSWTEVYALHVHDGALYAGGYFEYAASPPGWNAAEGIARWDGNGWSAVPGNLRGWVRTMTSWNGLLVEGGGTLLTQYPSKVLGWNGSEWSAIGDSSAGVVDGYVSALGEWQGALVAGGNQLTVPGSLPHTVVINHGSGWQPLGDALLAPSPLTTEVRAVASFGGDLYVGGSGLSLPGVGIRSLARWNGSAWVEVPGAPNGQVGAMVVRPDGLWVGFGARYSSGGDVWRWDGQQWTDLSLYAFSVYGLAEMDSDVWAVGVGYSSGPATVMQWHDGQWMPVQGGPDKVVEAVASLGHDLFIGGPFTHIGEHAAQGIARWTASTGPVTHGPIALSLGPNPATRFVEFRFTLSRAGHVRLSIHDLGGALVARPMDRDLNAGSTTLTWQLPGAHSLRAGVYFVKIETPDGEADTRIVVIR